MFNTTMIWVYIGFQRLAMLGTERKVDRKQKT